MVTAASLPTPIARVPLLRGAFPAGFLFEEDPA